MKGAAATVRASYRSWLARPRPAAVTTLRRWLRHVADRYRHSLQLRVTTATLILSAVMVSVLGYILMQHLVAGIYANMQRNSQIIVYQGLESTADNGSFTKPPNANTRQQMWQLAQNLASTGQTPYAVKVTLLPQFQGPPVYSGGAAMGFWGTPTFPQKLTAEVYDEWRGRGHVPQHPLQEWTSMAVAAGPRPVPGLLIGAPFGSDYEVYYFFPLAGAQQTTASIQQSLLLAGLAVVILLAAISWLVTRWVVVPVRQASAGARRLSAGELDQRMEVRGSDELATLATSFNEMAASLQDKLAELEDLSQVQRQFVSDVSHELRTPLTTIRIASDVLFGARDEMEPAAARSAELMQGQLERFESLLTDLLEISRYDANAATLDAEPADVGTIVLQSADIAQQLAERRGTRIEFRLPAEPCIAEVDRRRVERILRNLLLNAVEHGENRDVIVTAAMDSAAVAISVRDFGVGLRTGEDQLVFDRFWRADPSRTRTSGGTGLGLAIALEDARLHGGWLEAWGEPGTGSVFRLTLPKVSGGQLHGSPLPLSPLPLTAVEAVEPGLDGERAAAKSAEAKSAEADGAAAAREKTRTATEPATAASSAAAAGAAASGPEHEAPATAGTDRAADNRDEVAARG